MVALTTDFDIDCIPVTAIIVKDGQRKTNLKFRMRSNCVPMCVSYDGRSVRAVPFRDSNYVYIHATQSPAVDGEVTYVHFGVAVRARVFAGVDYNFVYMKVDQYIVTNSKAALATITRHFNGLYDSIYWDEPTDFSSIFRDRFPERDLNKTNDTKKK